MSKIIINEKGASGDSALRNVVSKKMRVPISSCKKFTPSLTPQSNITKQKLENALTQMLIKPQRIKKCRTVAEITPTKNRYEEKRLHETPMKQLYSDDCDRRRAANIIFQRMLLYSWRRNKARLATLTDSSRRQHNQVSQLEMQIEVLQNLRKSECEKRNEAVNNYKQIKHKLEVAIEENRILNDDKIRLENEMSKLKENVETVTNELLNARNCFATKISQTEQLESQLINIRKKLEEQKKDKSTLIEKLSKQEINLEKQLKTIKDLENKVRQSESDLIDVKCRNKQKLDEYNDLHEEFQLEVGLNSDLSLQLINIKSSKTELEVRIKDLINELGLSRKRFNNIVKENEELKKELRALCQDKLSWWRNAKDFAFVTAKILEHSVYLLLPALKY